MIINNIKLINKNPVFAIRLRTTLRENSNDVSQLTPDMLTDLSKMTAEITDIGMINLAFLKDMQTNWLEGLVAASKTAAEGQVDLVMETMKTATKVLLGLPNLQEYFIKIMIKPCKVEHPTNETMLKAKSKLNEV